MNNEGTKFIAQLHMTLGQVMLGLGVHLVVLKILLPWKIFEILQFQLWISLACLVSGNYLINDLYSSFFFNHNSVVFFLNNYISNLLLD